MISFTLVQRLGAGGFGDVYLARRNDTQGLVVLKYLREPKVAQNLRAFVREIRILGLGVEGVVELVAQNVECGQPFYAMPYYRSGPLTNWAGRLSPGQLHVIAQDLASGLGRLHAKWIYHGDLKPANILLGDDGRARIADPLGNGWGCTVLFAENRGGTPGYMAPEIARGGEISAAGDIYSLGATMYHLATGIAPQPGIQWEMTRLAAQALTPIRRTVRACLSPVASSRPNAAEILRILRGEKWEDITRAKEELSRGVLFTGAVLGLTALAVGGSRRS